MALRTFNVTLGAGATQLTGTVTPARHVIIQNRTGNDAVRVGKSNVSTTVYGNLIASGVASLVLGPFSGDAPVGLQEIYLLGTQNNIVDVLVITH